MKLIYKQSGYTLIELLVSISILVVLAASVAPSMSKAKKSQEMQQAALGIKTAISNAQSIALAPATISQDGDVGGDAGSLYNYYGIKIWNDDTTQLLNYQLVKAKCILECGNNPEAPEPVDGSLPAISFDTVKMVSPSPGPVYVWFNVGNNPQITLINGNLNNDSDMIIKIKNKDDSDGRNLTINKLTGVINVTNI